MIEGEHPTTFYPQNSNTSYIQPGSTRNPFAQLANGQNYQQPQIALKPTGFIQQPNVFGNIQPQQQQSTPRPFSSYLMSQPTGWQQLQPPQTSWFLQSPQQTFLQPQPTGKNLFRQSMLAPQPIGMALFGASEGQSTPNGQSSQGTPAPLPEVSAFSSPSSIMPLPAPTPSTRGSLNNTPVRPLSTLLMSNKTTAQPLQPVKSYQIGKNNPFGPITVTPPPVPKVPTLLELTTEIAVNGNASQSQQSAEEQLLPQQQTDAFNKFPLNNSALNPGAADISSVASSFTFNPNAVGSTIGDKSPSNNSGFMGSQQTGTIDTGLALSDSRFPQSNGFPTMSGLPLVTSHATGFGGLKPFIPSSTFGASLMESIPFLGSTSLYELDFKTLPSMDGERTSEPPTIELPTETHECGVCIELFSVAQSIQLPTCGHSFCRECLRTFTKTRIDEGRYPIVCPVCAIERTEVNNSHITQEIVDQLELSKQDIEKLSALQLVEHSIVWKCPKCKQTMNVDREEYGSERIIICPLPACRRPWCKECLKPLARSETVHNCKQQEFERLMRKKGWKYCPGCKTPVQKETGCNHITCGSPGCNVHFCYKCGVLIIDTSNGGDVGKAISKHYVNCER